MGSRERHMRQRSKTHAIPLIIVSLVGFLFIAGIAFGVGMLGNINRWLSDLPDYTDPDQYMVASPPRCSMPTAPRSRPSTCRTARA